MKLTKRLYTYPVLSEDKDDYINSIFDVSFEHKMSSVNTFTLSFEFIEKRNRKIKFSISIFYAIRNYSYYGREGFFAKSFRK